MIRPLLYLVCLASCAIAACAEESPTTASDDEIVKAGTPSTAVTVEGAIAGAPLVARTGAGHLLRLRNFHTDELTMRISESTGICTDFKANERRLTLTVHSKDGDLVPGTYPVVPPEAPDPENGTFASAALERTSAECLFDVDTALSAAGGTITLDHVTTAKSTGSFELDFGTSTVRGTFEAPDCLDDPGKTIGTKCTP